MDDVTRECLAAVVDTSISGKRVARELAQLVVVHGKPTTIVSDNGTELTSNAVEERLHWLLGCRRQGRNAQRKCFQAACPLWRQ